MSLPARACLAVILVLTTLGASSVTAAGTDPQPAASGPQAAPSDEAQQPDRGVLSDIKLYFTAPLRWDGAEWAWFGGALVAIGAAHQFDTRVRDHFVKNLSPGEANNSEDVHDAIPTLGVFVATLAYANLLDDNSGRREAWAMLEAVGLSGVTAYALKYVAGREGPDQANDPNEWLKGGGGSFPSLHATTAFAVGTVLAESGGDDYRWVRRLLGYGLGVFTSYERLKHNAHWLSDTIAGAALGTASAGFTMDRRYRVYEESQLSLVPVQGGAMLTYHLSLP